MTTQTINIKTTGLDPAHPIVKPGYQVTFQMDGRTDIVNVDFGTKSPFVSQVTQFSLNGAITSLASKTYTIADDADGHYYFFTEAPSLSKMDPEPPAAPPGDLEVSRDPSPPKEEK
jgi:hypothetical protein